MSSAVPFEDDRLYNVGNNVEMSKLRKFLPSWDQYSWLLVLYTTNHKPVFQKCHWWDTDMPPAHDLEQDSISRPLDRQEWSLPLRAELTSGLFYWDLGSPLAGQIGKLGEISLGQLLGRLVKEAER